MDRRHVSPIVSRRQWHEQSALGFGSLALAGISAPSFFSATLDTDKNPPALPFNLPSNYEAQSYDSAKLESVLTVKR